MASLSTYCGLFSWIAKTSCLFLNKFLVNNKENSLCSQTSSFPQWPDSPVLILCCVLLSVKWSKADAVKNGSSVPFLGLLNPQCWFPVAMVSVTGFFTSGILLLNCVSPVVRAPVPVNTHTLAKSSKRMGDRHFTWNRHLSFQPSHHFQGCTNCTKHQGD